MLKKFFLAAFLLFSNTSSFATHIVGGDLTARWLSGNDFEITFNFYRDCNPGNSDFDQTINVGVYDKATNVMQQIIVLPLLNRTILSLGDSCFTPPGLCVEYGLLQAVATIPDNVNGYYLTWCRCCRNSLITNIVNPLDAAIVFYLEIPNPALHNSSPAFGSYPDAYMCASQLNSQNFSCNDVDGDSLVYSLQTPFNGPASPTLTTPIPPQPAPYSFITWQAPYSGADMIGGSPVLNINSQTGILQGSPPNLGVYVFSVLVEEFRGGIKIGEIRRDIQYQVLTCNLIQPIYFVAPDTSIHTYTVVAGTQLSFPVKVDDLNPSDTVSLCGTSELFAFPELQFACDTGISEAVSQFTFAPSCDFIRDEPYHVTLIGQRENCYGLVTVHYDFDIQVVPVFAGSLDSLTPNVFTPNGDGKNDFFQLGIVNDSCFTGFRLKIYNRWGQEVFESTDAQFKWNGTTKDKKLPEGVYYYVMSLNLRNKKYEHHGNITLKL